MQTQFELDNLEQFRDLDNYKVIDLDTESNNRCLVCFSSNGLYEQNTNEALNQVVKSDRYEWQRIINKGFARIIYIRDIYKQWYVKGINNQCDSVEKLFRLLSELTNGYNCTFIGSSAGGYAAVLFGSLLNADKIINFSGQFDIKLTSKCKTKNQIVHQLKETSYFDVSSYSGNIFYFFPIDSNIDKEQYELIKDNSSVHVIKVRSGLHGIPVLPFALKTIVNTPNKQLYKLTKRTHHKVIISLQLINFVEFIRYFKFKLFKK